MKAVEAIAISPRDAEAFVTQLRARTSRGRAATDGDRAKQNRAVADLIVKRYALLAAGAGGATALTGVIPGLGTIIATAGGAVADAAVSMKFQIDMCICLTFAFDVSATTEEKRHLAFLIATTGTVEGAGTPVATRVASQAGVRLVRQYLRGAALETIKALFKRIGIIFTRKALEKAIPFGIGVIISSSANYALTRYVGAQAIRWFELNSEMPEEPGPSEA
jgi:hypothetical protein